MRIPKEDQMRAFPMLAAAGALASVLLSFAGSLSTADARITVAQCRSKELACKKACLLSLNGMPATQGTVYGLTQCLNGCWDNHAACVDFAMSSRAAAAVAADPPPPKSNFTPVPNGLLDTAPGFAAQGPAATGTPVAPVAPAPKGPSLL
jgi:hypothetical protein